MGKRHSYIQKRLLLYFDGELPEKEHRQVEHHLDTCATCQGLGERLRSLYLAEAIETPSLPPFLYSKISNRLQTPTDRVPVFTGWMSFLRPAFMLMLVLLSILTGHFLGSSSSSQNVAEMTVNNEQVVYESFGLSRIDPFAEFSMVGAVNAVYNGQ